MRSIQSHLFYENANGNPLEISGSRGSIFRGVTMPKYFLHSAGVGNLGRSYREELVAVKVISRCQKNPRYDFDIFKGGKY